MFLVALRLPAMLACASSSSRKLVTQRAIFILARRQPRRLVSQPSLTHDHLNLTSPNFNADLASRDRSGFSDLGLRSSRPPDSIPDSDPKTPSEIPDQDWELRTGRAIYVLQQTLPDFFATGLITSIDKRTGAPVPPSTSIPIASANPLDYLPFDDDAESIYSPFVQSSYTPPVPLPAPFPKVLHVEGLQLYLACSGFVRHTMNALYSDLSVTLTKVAVNTPSSPTTTKSPGGSAEMGTTKKKGREKSLLVRQNVTGIARVSGKPGEWMVESTYTFSPSTGLIHKHVINSICPAPHVAVYESLRASMGKLLGLGGGSAPSPNGAACRGAGKV